MRRRLQALIARLVRKEALRLPTRHMAAQALGIEVPGNFATTVGGLYQRIGRMGVARLRPNVEGFRVALAAFFAADIAASARHRLSFQTQATEAKITQFVLIVGEN